jgi:ankyrin repeat protein
MALHGASMQGHLEVMRLLLEKGADIQAKAKVSAFCFLHVGCGGGN